MASTVQVRTNSPAPIRIFETATAPLRRRELRRVRWRVDIVRLGAAAATVRPRTVAAISMRLPAFSNSRCPKGTTGRMRRSTAAVISSPRRMQARRRPLVRRTRAAASRSRSSKETRGDSISTTRVRVAVGRKPFANISTFVANISRFIANISPALASIRPVRMTRRPVLDDTSPLLQTTFAPRAAGRPLTAIRSHVLGRRGRPMATGCDALATTRPRTAITFPRSARPCLMAAIIEEVFGLALQ